MPSRAPWLASVSSASEMPALFLSTCACVHVELSMLPSSSVISSFESSRAGVRCRVSLSTVAEFYIMRKMPFFNVSVHDPRLGSSLTLFLAWSVPDCHRARTLDVSTRIFFVPVRVPMFTLTLLQSTGFIT